MSEPRVSDELTKFYADQGNTLVVRGLAGDLRDCRARCAELEAELERVTTLGAACVALGAERTRERDEAREMARNIIPIVSASMDAVRNPIPWAAKMEAQRDALQAHCEELDAYAKELEQGKREAWDMVRAVTRERDEAREIAKDAAEHVLLANDIVNEAINEAAGSIVGFPEIRPGDRVAAVLAKLAERDRLAAQLAERDGQVAVLVSALNECRDLFSEIRNDWTDPRSQCREGWRIIDAAVADTAPRAKEYR